jgi:hypothetical protein
MGIGMVANIRRLVYFEEFMNPVALSILGERTDIELGRLEYASPEDENWGEIGRAHGYQIQPRTERTTQAVVRRCGAAVAMPKPAGDQFHRRRL